MNQIKHYREAAGISQKELAERAQTTVAQISRLESGARRLSDHWAERLGKSLNVDPWRFFVSGKIADGHKIKILGNVTGGFTRHTAVGERHMPIGGIDEAELEWKDYILHDEGGDDLYALAVTGNSMSLFAPSGSFIICQNIKDRKLPLSALHGKPLIVHDILNNKYHFKFYDDKQGILRPHSHDSDALPIRWNNGFTAIAVVLEVKNRGSERL